MADKRDIRQAVRRIRRVKTWQLVILLVMSAFVSATFLRLNNVGMVERREAVYAADEAGDLEQLERRLYDLQRYVSSHMNANPGRIALENSYVRYYERALEEFKENIARQSSNDVVQRVREVCDAEAAAGGWGRFTTQADPRYVECISREWEKYPAAATSDVQFVPPPVQPYYHTFVSPLWSPDYAGWSVLVTGLIFVVIIVRLGITFVLFIMIKVKYRRA